MDFSIFKNFRFGETRKIQLRADFFNLFNHPQYIPGSPNDIQPVATTAVGQVNTITAATLSLTNPGAATFNRPDRVFPVTRAYDPIGFKVSTSKQSVFVTARKLFGMAVRPPSFFVQRLSE